jgi:HD-like signal output (HDOD) protein
VNTVETTPAAALTPDDLVRDLKQLPSTPCVLPRLAKLLKSDSASIGDVIELIRVDTAITARTIQIGSSIYYSPHGDPCENVEEAVNRVGFNEVYKLVSYAATAQLLLRPLASYGLDTNDTWRISVTCALAAEQLASHVGVDRSLAYTVGLLHTAGLIALDAWRQLSPPVRPFLSKGLPKETIESEIREFGFHNATVAGALLHLWEFPSSIVDPISWQYEPQSAKAEPTMACLLHVAKWLRDAVHISDDQPAPPEPDEWILHTLRLSSRDLEVSIYTVRAAFLEVSKLLLS